MPTYDDLVAKYRALSDPELNELMRAGQGAFTPEAWRALYDEVHRRGGQIEPVPPSPSSAIDDLRRALRSHRKSSLEEILRDPEVRRVAQQPLDAAAEGLANAATPLTNPDTYRRLARHFWLSALYAASVALVWFIRANVKGHQLYLSTLLFYFVIAWIVIFLVLPVRDLVWRWFRRRELY